MRERPAARLLVVDAQGRALLFRFAHVEGPLAGQSWWATPGGALDPGEAFEQGAIRELREETGLEISTIGPEIGRREFEMQMPDGEWMLAQERFFRIDVVELEINPAGWTELERRVMVEHRWWSEEELLATADKIYPENLVALLQF